MRQVEAETAEDFIITNNKNQQKNKSYKYRKMKQKLKQKRRLQKEYKSNVKKNWQKPT